MTLIKHSSTGEMTGYGFLIVSRNPRLSRWASGRLLYVFFFFEDGVVVVVVVVWGTGSEKKWKTVNIRYIS